MTPKEMLTEIDMIIEESKTAVLATSDKSGNPRMRWMTPVLLKDREGAIYAVTSPKFEKARQLEENPKIEWMFQTKNLDRVITVRGEVSMIENSSLKSEVLEALGRRLTAFWKLNANERDLTVLETVCRGATLFLPMKGTKSTVQFE